MLAAHLVFKIKSSKRLSDQFANIQTLINVSTVKVYQ